MASGQVIQQRAASEDISLHMPESSDQANMSNADNTAKAKQPKPRTMKNIVGRYLIVAKAFKNKTGIMIEDASSATIGEQVERNAKLEKAMVANKTAVVSLLKRFYISEVYESKRLLSIYKHLHKDMNGLETEIHSDMAKAKNADQLYDTSVPVSGSPTGKGQNAGRLRLVILDGDSDSTAQALPAQQRTNGQQKNGDNSLPMKSKSLDSIASSRGEFKTPAEYFLGSEFDEDEENRSKENLETVEMINEENTNAPETHIRKPLRKNKPKQNKT